MKSTSKMFKTLITGSVVLFLSLTPVGSLVLANAAVASATWTPAGDLALARLAHRATLLADGRVLVTGGNTAVGNTYDTKLAEIYDPATNSWSTTGSTTNGRSQGHTATRLDDGRVLVTGGVNANVCTFDNTAELYDPATGTWSFTGSLAAARYYATATPLPDGTVLVAGGGNRCGAVFSSAEIYDPATGTWSPTGSMTTPREFHDAVPLVDGRVLVVGGDGPCCTFPALSSAEIYDPATGTWTPTGSMATTRAHPILTLLADGRVMAFGGASGSGCCGHFPNGPDVEIFDPATETWSPTGSLSVARSGGSSTLLSNGMVLAAGGNDGSAFHASAELWDPATGTWSATASMASPRASHSATLLPDGSVLAASGHNGPCCESSAERYHPMLAILVDIDIKPGSDPNSISLKSKGVILVAILTTDDFDASDVDPATVLFGPTGTEAAPVHFAFEDVDGDGDIDMILHFNTQDTGIQCGDTSASLTGQTFGGLAIEGSDSINTVGCQ